MTETLPFLLKVSALPTEAIAPAIRLAADLSVSSVLTEDKAIAAANVRASVWDRIRPNLVEIFEFTGGRVKMRSYADIDPFDLLAIREAAKEMRKRPTKESKDPRVLTLIALGMDEQKAKAFVPYLIRTYGEKHSEAAIQVAKEKTPTEVRGFIIKVIQNRIGADNQNGSAPGDVKRVLHRVKVTNPEAAKTELLGWEAPVFDSLGVPSYSKGIRQQIWRSRIGVAVLSPPPPNTKVPTPLEDPGVMIVETYR